jgi:MFS transporter, DHA1 family, inner membrane transport protein
MQPVNRATNILLFSIETSALQTPQIPADQPRHLPFQVAFFTSIHMVLNSAYRMVYPFLPIFSHGLGVDLTTLSLALTARSLTGLASPFLAPVSDLHGRKTGMLLGLGVFTSGVMLVAIWPSYLTFFLALLLGTLGNYIFLPAVQAYLGDRVLYQKRGRVLAIIELSWSLSFILGVPLVGFLINRLGWASPFPIFGGLGILAVILLAILIPNDSNPEQKQGGIWDSLRAVLSYPPAQAVLTMSVLLTGANEVVNVVFGAWMENSFGLQIAALGAASAVLGLAEMGGELASSGWVDRLGKPRAILIGVSINCASALALPFLGRISPAGAVLGLFFFYLSFEFSVVSAIALVSAVLPPARATLMAANAAAFSLGRAIGDSISTPLFHFGILGCAAAALAFNLLALLALRKVSVQE